VLAVGINYQTPKWRQSRVLSAVLRDWTAGGYFSYSSGLPIESPIGQNNLQLLLFQTNNTSISSGQNSSTSASGTFMNRVPGQPLFLKDLNCHCIDPNRDFVLNPAAWSNPASWHLWNGGCLLQRLPLPKASGRTTRHRPSVQHS
jgi:hypothetical protein